MLYGCISLNLALAHHPYVDSQVVDVSDLSGGMFFVALTTATKLLLFYMFKFYFKTHIPAGFTVALAVFSWLAVSSHVYIKDQISRSQVITHALYVLFSIGRVLATAGNIVLAWCGYTLTADRRSLDVYNGPKSKVGNFSIAVMGSSDASSLVNKILIYRLPHQDIKTVEVLGKKEFSAVLPEKDLSVFFKRFKQFNEEATFYFTIPKLKWKTTMQ